MTGLIRLVQVDLAYGFQRVLTGVNLEVRPGRMYRLEGPNGAGKTTLLRCIAGLKRPTRGTVLREPSDLPVGWLGHDAPLYPEWSARQYARWLRFTFFPHVRGDPRPEDPLLRTFWDEPLRHFSRGMQQRFLLFCLDIWGPPIVCLDEPWTGLDAQAQADLNDLLQKWRRRGQGVLFSSHRSVDVDLPVDEVWSLRDHRVYRVANGE
ncbi:Zinc import ATP-binding protein ZnuC [bacterium HR11]|nr:Zinc import ATP-binding protein ZnuC [bacterium HR11]